MEIDTSKLRTSTKSVVSVLIAFGTLMQIPVVSQLVLQAAAAHHHLATIIAAATGIALALHNPEVQDALGIKHTTEVTEKTETVVLAKDREAKL